MCPHSAQVREVYAGSADTTGTPALRALYAMNVAFTTAPEQLATLALYRKGESDLLWRGRCWAVDWFRLATSHIRCPSARGAPSPY